MADDLWHVVEAKRDDGQTVMFRIRDLAPRPELARIFVVELPFETAELSLLPDTAAHRRLQTFEEQWLGPACAVLGWVFVGVRTEDSSYFLYLYGRGEPNDLIARLAPFDAAVGFYDDDDPAWDEYATLRGLLDEAKTRVEPGESSRALAIDPDAVISTDRSRPEVTGRVGKAKAPASPRKKPKKQ